MAELEQLQAYQVHLLLTLEEAELQEWVVEDQEVLLPKDLAVLEAEEMVKIVTLL
jgi:hypothetical protein